MLLCVGGSVGVGVGVGGFCGDGAAVRACSLLWG